MVNITNAFHRVKSFISLRSGNLLFTKMLCSASHPGSALSALSWQNSAQQELIVQCLATNCIGSRVTWSPPVHKYSSASSMCISFSIFIIALLLKWKGTACRCQSSMSVPRVARPNLVNNKRRAGGRDMEAHDVMSIEFLAIPRTILCHLTVFFPCKWRSNVGNVALFSF